MAKIVETTELTGGLTSFRTEIDVVDTSSSLGTRYQHYKDLLENDGPTVADQPSTANE